MKFSDNINNISPSGTFEIFAIMKEMIRKGNDVIPLVAGELDFKTPENIAGAGINAIKDGHTGYTLNSGIPELREAICNKLKEDNSLTYTPDQILVSSGSKHAVFSTIYSLCGKNDEVIIFSPYYPSYPEIIKLAGATPVIIETDIENKFEINIEKLQNAVTDNTKMIILNSPNNPTGKVVSKETIKQISEIIIKHNLYLLSDEIYEKILFDDYKHYSPSEIVPEMYERTIIVNGFSKTYAMTGWRIGYAVGPEAIIQKAALVQSHMTSNASSIAQHAALEALTSGQQFIDSIQPKLLKRRDDAFALLAECSNVQIIKPDSAFYFFFKYSKNVNLSSAEIAKKLLINHGVAVVPGIAFGAENYLRISFATDYDSVIEGVKRVKTGLSQILSS